MADDDREAAIRLAEASADRFMRSFLHLLIHVGTDLPLGPDHHVRLRLEIEVARDGDGEVVEREVLNRGGARCFDEYWGRWINRPGAEAAIASD